MDKKELFEFYKSIHNREFERKEKIEQGLSLPITIIFGLSTLIYLLLSEFDFKYNSSLSKYFLPLLGTTAVFLLLSIISTIVAYILTGSYRAEPFAKGLEKYRLDTEQYYQQVSQSTWKQDSQDDFVDYLTTLYIDQASDNTQRNDYRGTWIERVKINLVVSLLFAVLSLLPFILNFLNKPDKVYNIQTSSLTQRLDSLILNEKLLRQTQTRTSKDCPCCPNETFSTKGKAH